MIRKTALKVSASAAAILAVLSPNFISASGGRWKIDIQVEMQGRYTVRLGPAAVHGDFSGVLSWSGFLEDDDGDFLLIHAQSEVLDWTIREQASENPTPSYLTENDIPERPALNISYILRDRDIVDIRLSVHGFEVPLHAADVSFALPLPSSRADSNRLPKAAYDAAIVEGSNRIFLRNRDLKAPDKKKSFAWTWQRHDWLPLRDRTVEFFSRHEAEVTVTIAHLR
ncbi:MAG: hypothetical protein SCM96_05945 [Acidobacteriota bacterium]|nr:hypothetical protein [Acidobacteriota bacterium]